MFPVKPLRSGSAQRRHDEVAVGLRALGVRLHVLAVLEVLVHDLALGGAHGVERDRAAAAHGVVGRLVGLAVERLGAAVAVAGGVDDHPLRPVLRRGGGAVGQVLHRVDGGAVAADEEPEVARVERRADDALLLLDLDVGLEGKSVVDALEQLADAVGRGGGRVAHRRRPERFFFLRGGAGGGPLPALPFAVAEPPSPAATAAVGDSLPRGRLPPPPLPAALLLPPPAAASAFSFSLASLAAAAACSRSGPRRFLMIDCCTIVHRFVVIQYTSSPAGKRQITAMKKNGSARKIRRWLRSAVADISSVETSCVPT